jgi:dipeptidyl-peptidase-4
MMPKSRLLASVLLACLASPAMAEDAAQQRAPQPLTLERVFGSPGLNGQTGGAQKLSPDGTLLTSLKPRADEGNRMDLWAMDTRTGQSRMLVDSKAVGTGAELSEEEKMQRERKRIGSQSGIVSYDWAPDGKSILVPLDGDLYLATLDGKARRLTETPEAELNAVVSPAGRYVSFVRDQNVWAVDAAGGQAKQLTQGGGGTIHFGEAEFVAQEEMSRYTGYWWSPDDAMIAVQKYDEAPVGIVSRAAIGAEGTKVYDQRYPRAGTPNVLNELYVMRADGSSPVKVDLGRETDIYIARVDWAPDASALYVQRQSRDQKRLDMLKVDPKTGRSSVLFTEKSGERSWINLSDAYRFMDDGSVIWWSERDGHGHLYRFAGGKFTQLTKGDWEVADIAGYDEAKDRLFFTANKDGVLERHLYAMDLARPAQITQLTEAGWWNLAKMDDAASRVIINRSNPDSPPQTFLADANGKQLSWIAENRLAEGHPYFPFVASHRPSQFGTLKAADGTTLHWRMITPPLEPGKKYPVFFQHYGGPGSQQVMHNWGKPLDQYLVDKGWVVFTLDNRGSANRGKAFEDHIYHAMGSVEVADQLAGAEWLKRQDFVDPAKIATYGWSYGGYMTAKMLAANPGVYAAGIAGAPVTQWDLYDTHYTERFLGDPKKDPKSYSGSDVIPEAAKIVDPMLVIHGMADDNVILTNTTLLMSQMQKNAQPFESMLYPGQTHSVGGPGISVHLWKTIEDFLDRHVLEK